MGGAIFKINVVEADISGVERKYSYLCSKIQKEMPKQKIQTGSDMHLSHRMMLAIAIAFSWVLWSIVNFDVFRQMSGWPLVLEILKEFGEQVVETTVLLELSLLYIRMIVKAFWNKAHSIRNILLQVMLLAVLNGISSILVGVIYYQIYPSKQYLFAKIVFTDYLDLSVLTTAWLVIFLMNRYKEISNEAGKHAEPVITRLALVRGVETIFCDISEISHIVYSAGTSRVYLRDGRWGDSYTSLLKVSETLPEKQFFQISRQAVVNLDMVAGLAPGNGRESFALLKEPYSSARLKVSSERRKELLNTIS